MRQKGLLKVPSWKKIIFQLRKKNFQQGNKIFPTGRFRLSSWFYVKLFLCKVFFVLAIMWESRFWGSVLGGRGI